MTHEAPIEITDLRNSGVLRVRWSDGLQADLTHALLRCRCRCAACTQALRSGTPVEADAELRIAAIAPIGERGLNFVFSDGHGRGIYPWAYLRELSESSVSAAGV